MNLTTLANVAEIIGAVIVIGGLAFGVIQLQQFRLQRRARATIEVARSFRSALLFWLVEAEGDLGGRRVLTLPRPVREGIVIGASAPLPAVEIGRSFPDERSP